MLNRAKDYYENDKERLREKKNTETYLKKIRINNENMEETDITISLRKRNKD